MNIEHISVSRSKTYKQCAQHYKFHYHLKIKSPEEEKFWFVYGKIVHKIAEDYVESKGKRPLGEIWDDVRRGKILIENAEAPALPPEYAKRLPIHLRSIQRITDKIGCDGVVEHPFHYDLDPPNGKFVKGFIDRLMIRKDHAFILDYKTTKKGKWRTDKHSVKYDPQLRMYCRVVQKEFGIPAQNIRAGLYYLEDEELVAASYSEESLIKIEEEMLAIYNQIHNHDPEHVRGSVGEHCNRCPFATLCPFFKHSKAVNNLSVQDITAMVGSYRPPGKGM